MSSNHRSRVRKRGRRKFKMPELLLINFTINLQNIKLEISILSMTIRNCQYLTISDPQKQQSHMGQFNIIHIALKQPGEETNKNHPILPDRSASGEGNCPQCFCFVLFYSIFNLEDFNNTQHYKCFLVFTHVWVYTSENSNGISSSALDISSLLKKKCINRI